jgi:hypothetical protein
MGVTSHSPIIHRLSLFLSEKLTQQSGVGVTSHGADEGLGYSQFRTPSGSLLPFTLCINLKLQLSGDEPLGLNVYAAVRSRSYFASKTGR